VSTNQVEIFHRGEWKYSCSEDTLFGYGVVAGLIDEIADKHDVVFVISAGNLRAADCCSEWPEDSQTALVSGGD
jgi:hypothetical protein